MRHLLLITFLFFTTSVFAQKAEVDKNGGIVQVDGKDMFYLVKTNKRFLTFDLSLENLDHKQLAYLTAKEVDDLPYDQRGTHVGMYFQFTFNSTSNTAPLFVESMSVVKYVAKQIVRSALVQNGAIEPQAEKNFVVTNNGKIFTDPNLVRVVVANESANTKTKTADITVKGKNIYNNGEMIGSFKQSTKDGISTISVYNSNDALAATASHPDADDNADWKIISATDGKSYQFLYTAGGSFEKMFKFLAEKSIL